MICTKLDDDLGILLQVAHGDILLSEVVAAVDRRFQDPRYDPYRPVLWNLVDAQWGGAYQEFGFVAEEISGWLKTRLPLGAVAVVLGSVTEQALFDTFYNLSGWMNLRTFTDVDDARAWLVSQKTPSR